MNYYEKHIGDYIRDTVSLTMLEDGAYGRMMDQVYQSEKPLPLDKKMVYRLARAASTSDRKAVDFVLATFFQETPAGYVQKRIAQEIDRYQEKQRKAKASADARWNKPRGDANASQTHAEDMRTHCEGNAHQSPVTSNQTQSINPEASRLASTEVRDDLPKADSPPKTPPAIGRNVAISILLRAGGIDATPANPLVCLDWAENPKVTDDVLSLAVVKARTAKPDQRISVNYLKPIVAELLAAPEAKAKAEDNAWRKTDAGIERKGRELGMFARGSEKHWDFAARIQTEIDKRKARP